MSSRPGAGDKALGLTIRIMRTERGIDRKTLASLTGLSYPYLSEIEGGRKHPSTRVLGQIAEALDVELSELIAGAESRMGGVVASPRTTSAPPPMEPVARAAASAPQESWFHDRQELVAHAMLSEPAGGPRDDDITDELLDLVRRLDPSDQRRLLDLARRLSS
ncbi:MAG TPA: helix-turn-helix transcriptional regulator [Actinomycetota bacterium]|nr:helix-turn-helix transcriptional regulator [Actinomycetota bacterium]